MKNNTAISIGFSDVSDRTKLRLTGEDRQRFLHAMTTNHVQQLETGQGLYAFFLNAQGRILADLEVYALADGLLVDAAPELRQKIVDHLEHYIIADDVELEDLSESWFAIQVEGVEAKQRLLQTVANLPEHPFGVQVLDGCPNIFGWWAGFPILWTATLQGGAIRTTRFARNRRRPFGADQGRQRCREIWRGFRRKQYSAGDRYAAGLAL
jgi:folate-binding Fe-S cluster repair protein YgfZ